MKAVTAIAGLILAACAHQEPAKAPVPALPVLSVPVSVIQAVCGQARPEQGSGHFDGQAHLLWNTAGAVVALECGLTVTSDGLSTSSVRVYRSDVRAQALRDFLRSQGY